jgi:hypothetical protein
MSDDRGGAWTTRVGALGLLGLLAAALAVLLPVASAAGASGLLLVAGGVVAVLLLGFPTREILAAIGSAAGADTGPPERWRGARVWEGAARAAWLLSAASAVTGFVAVLAADPGGLARLLGGVGERAAGVTVGVLVAVVSSLAALRLRAGAEGPSETSPPPSVWQLALGGAALAALLAWPLVGHGPGERFGPVSWLFHGPAWLVTAGGALAVALYLRELRRGAALTVALGAAGTVAILLGLARGLHGFATRSIDDVAGGLTFALSSGYAALVGLAAAGLPLLDRDARRHHEAPAAARWTPWVFPLVVLACVFLTILLVAVPIEKTVP